MKLASAIGAIAAASAIPAAGEVRTANADSFEVEHRVDTALDPDRLYALIGQPSCWWSDAHSFSGRAANLSVALEPRGCWCERMPDGTMVTHLTVDTAEPGRRLLLQGLLGPLKTMAKAGRMSWTITPRDQGSTLVLNYKVDGIAPGKAVQLAPAVDRVLGEQVARLDTLAEGLAARR